MFKGTLTLVSVFVGGFGFLLGGQKPTNDHDLIRYLDNIVTNLVNLTGKLEKDIATKNDLTQFLQSDLHHINATLNTETQRRQNLEAKVRQLETSLTSEKTANSELRADLVSFKALVRSLQNELTDVKHKIDTLKVDINATNLKQVNDSRILKNTIAGIGTDVDHIKNQTGKACFFSLRNGMRTPSDGLEFSEVLANYGNGYDVTSGSFLAPYNGVYIFTLTLSAMTDTFTNCYIVKNRYINLVEAFTSVVVGYCSATTSSIVRLVKEDYITVENCHGNGTISPYKTSFSGSLLHAN